MGYDVRITRKARWYEDVGPVITEDEWRSLVNSRSDLELYDNVGAKADVGVRVLSVTDRENAMIWWQPRLGEIRTKNPSGGLVEQMVKIARELNAVVMGDEGETYHAPDRLNVPIPSFEDPKNVANVWRMPTSEEIKALDKKHAEWVAKIRSTRSEPISEVALKRPNSSWQLILAALFILWLLWKAFGASQSVMN